MAKQAATVVEISRGRRKPRRAPVKVAPLAPTWPERLHELLRDLDIRLVSYVPDAGHARLIELVHEDAKSRAIPLTTEEEGVAFAVGAWLGGARSVLLTQSSGVGNCINMLGMIQECRVPLLMLVTMRGEWGEFNPWQIAMGQGTAKLLEHAGCVVQRVDRAEDVGEVVFAGGQMAFSTSRPVAILLAQRLVGFKDWSK
jgi:sulfopyruvate decarboxylase alpha subunit